MGDDFRKARCRTREEVKFTDESGLKVALYGCIALTNTIKAAALTREVREKALSVLRIMQEGQHAFVSVKA